MKILFISHYAGRTGAPLLMLNMLTWLKENSRLDFEILLLDGGPLVSDFSSLAKVHMFPDKLARNKSLTARIIRKLGLSFSDRSARKRLLGTLGKSDISLIYANTFTTGRALEFLAPLKCPVITHVHELNYWIEMSGEENRQQILKNTTRYIAGSEAVKTNLVDNCSLAPGKIDVVHEFIPVDGIVSDPSGLRQQFNIPEEAFVVLGSGHETWRKGKDIFVQLAAHVRKVSSELPVYFLWVGGWQKEEDRRNILHDVNMLGLTGKVHFTGGVTNTHRYFAAGDVFAMVSREDPFPLVCLEAALEGKPVLCFADAGGVPELVEDDAGFIVPYLDLAAMAEKIVFLANDPAARKRLGDRAAEKVRNHYTVETGSMKILEIIRNVSAPQQKTSP